MKNYLIIKRSVLVGVVVISAILFTSVTIAAIDNEVNACVNNKTGAVRILNFLGGQCTKSETSLAWNKQGPIGLKGPQGIEGVIGPKGDKGENGEQGIQGEKGDAGETGPAGISGSQLHLYDANNQDLGIFVQGGLPEDNNTYRSFDPQSGLIVLTALNNNLHEASVFPHGANSIYFESNDCTGIPFTHPTGVMNVIHQKIFSGGSFHYYKEINVRNIIGVSRVAQSRQDVTGTCFPSSTSIPESLQLQEVTLSFTEPITWPLEVR